MSKQRLKLGILFYFSSHWMGGIIYILNIIKTLDHVEEDDKPEIFLFYRPGLKKFVDEINYPYMKAVEWSFPSIVKGNILSFIMRKNLFIDGIIRSYQLDAIYPMHDFPVKTKTKTKLIGWCADLQHKHYPEFFSKAQIIGRNMRIKLSLKNNDDIVLSSQDVMDDFTRFYKLRKGLNFHIFHFVSIIDNMEVVKIEDLRLKYKLPDKYFLVSNQFHKHKNHKVLLLALAKLKEKGIIRHLAITGKFPAASGSRYLTELNRIIDENDLHGQITLLGLISRSDQLNLMRHSQAVLQPSLFEGWSTVIEDARSLQVPVVASNLKVNIEQLGKDGLYFDPHNADELASIMAGYPVRNLNDIYYEDYQINVRNAAKKLMVILN